MLFKEGEYGTADWLKGWLTSAASEATGRILLDVIEASEGGETVEVLIEVLAHGCIVVHL